MGDEPAGIVQIVTGNRGHEGQPGCRGLRVNGKLGIHPQKIFGLEIGEFNY